MSCPASLTSHEFFFTLHCHNPCAPTRISKRSNQELWFYKTPTLTIAIGPPGGKIVVSLPCKMNLDNMTLADCARDPPLESAVREQNTGSAKEELGVKNMDKCLGNAKENIPSSPTVCFVVSELWNMFVLCRTSHPFPLLRRIQPLTIPSARLNKNQMEGMFNVIFGTHKQWIVHVLKCCWQRFSHINSCVVDLKNLWAQSLLKQMGQRYKTLKMNFVVIMWVCNGKRI